MLLCFVLCDPGQLSLCRAADAVERHARTLGPPASGVANTRRLGEGGLAIRTRALAYMPRRLDFDPSPFVTSILFSVCNMRLQRPSCIADERV